MASRWPAKCLGHAHPPYAGGLSRRTLLAAAPGLAVPWG